MTKLVVVLAVIVVVILVVVIVAVRNMRAEDPDEFDDQFGGRGGRTRGSQGGRDPRYGSDRRPAGGSRPAKAAAGSSGRQGRPASAGRGLDDRHDQRAGQSYGQPAAERRRGDTGPQRADEGQAPARARRRPSDSSEWDSSEWDKLSDVDYWAELASQKPLTTTAQPASQPPAKPDGGGQARPRPDLERDPLAAPGSRPGFAAAPVPVDGTASRPRTGAEPGADQRRGGHRHRQPASADGDRGAPDRARPAAARNSDHGRPDRSRLAGASGTGRSPRFLDGMGRDRNGYLSSGPASLPLPAIRDVPPTRPDRPQEIPARPDRPQPEIPARRDPLADAPAARQGRPRAVYDDDPLTSPSFPKVPSDGRSYHSGRSAGPQRDGRADTPRGSSRAGGSQLEPTQQFASYEGPAGSYDAPQGNHKAPAAGYEEPGRQYAAPQHPAAYAGGQHSAPPPPAAAQHLPERPAARHSGPRHLANGSNDAHRTGPNGYLPDPLTSQNPYPYPYDPRESSAPPGAAPTASARTSNPYGSYVTPDSQQAAASPYDSYPATTGNGHQPSYPPADPGGMGHSGNGYWPQSPALDGPAGPGAGRYPDSAAQADDLPDSVAPEPGYLNGYGQPGQAEYLGNGSHAHAPDPAGYPQADQYGSDEYGGYREYGAAGG